MFLSDVTLKKLCQGERPLVANLCENAIQPASIDCRISNSFATIMPPPDGIICMDKPVQYNVIEADTYVLQPGSFVLATTMEYLHIPDNIASFVDGRSSIGRIGLFIENAGWIAPGFEGEITLELFNATLYPIRLVAGHRVGQFVFATTDEMVKSVYRGKYQGQRGVTGSMLYLDSEFKN